MPSHNWEKKTLVNDGNGGNGGNGGSGGNPISGGARPTGDTSVLSTPTPTSPSVSSLPSTAQGLSASQTQTFTPTSSISGSPTQSSSISSSIISGSSGASQPHASSALRSLRHTRAVIAISVSMGVVLIIVLITLVFGLRHRRRRTRTAARRTNQQANTVSPFTLLDSQMDVPNNSNTTAPGPDESNGHSISASTLRRQHLKNQLREKMVDIADLERSTAVAVPPPSAPRRFLRLLSTRSTSQRESDGGQDLASELEAARARIHELEAHMNSEWALGFSDEPPPWYTA
ncbi:hypothetical protein C8R44DRAFT_974434 [Mycena epipterygia]|nr:hypothetical protein C8R44DRAFT_974434 [Mycena epipterygia]